jgi:DNA ligase-1
MGDWDPGTVDFQEMIFEENHQDQFSRPYPFYLAYALDSEPEDLGTIDHWIAEWKWDGIRGQIINRNNNLYVWSRGEELITDKFPEFSRILDQTESDYVLDGEIICYKDGAVMPFNILQKRIGRKNVSKKMMGENPAVMIAYDILEYKGEDLRELPMYERRILLESLCEDLKETGVVLLSELVEANSWEGLKDFRYKSREKGAEGLMLKKKDSAYRVGRKRGDWWKWKVDPMTVDAVMIYAQRGHGRRANLYTDFTFAVYDEDGKLVPFAKAYSGLTDKEFNEITRWVRKNTIERFGPVCMVEPSLVFELAFEGIAESKRHKSGIALRFPRIKRWRKDKPIEDIDTLATLKEYLS